MFFTSHGAMERRWAVDSMWDRFLDRMNDWEGLTEEQREPLPRHRRSDCEATVLTYKLVAELRDLTNLRRDQVIEIDD
jgi:hypothetical protein